MATSRQRRYCNKRAENTFWNDREKLRTGKDLEGWWYPPMNNGYATRVERFTEYRTTLTHTAIIKYNGKITMETEVFHFADDKVDYSSSYRGELIGTEKEAAERMLIYK